jgi:hypothetical protein
MWNCYLKKNENLTQKKFQLKIVYMKADNLVIPPKEWGKNIHYKPTKKEPILVSSLGDIKTFYNVIIFCPLFLYINFFKNRKL